MKDVFICHANEDKDQVVFPLISALDEQGISHWLDQVEVGWGDSLIGKINEGLSNSRFVVVILSKSFLSKKWPQRELNSVMNVEITTGEVKVLPLIVGNVSEIVEQFTLLKDKKYFQWKGDNTTEIIDALASRLKLLKKSNQPDKLSRDTITELISKIALKKGFPRFYFTRNEHIEVYDFKSDSGRRIGYLVLRKEEIDDLGKSYGVDLEQRLELILFGSWKSDNLDEDWNFIHDQVIKVANSIFSKHLNSQGTGSYLNPDARSMTVYPIDRKSGKLTTNEVKLTKDFLTNLLKTKPIERAAVIADLCEQLD